MSRQTKEYATSAYRAVVTTSNPAIDGREAWAKVEVYGPYQNIGAARAAATREGRVWPHAAARGVTTSTKIQRTTLAWEDVES